jgi:hypothetical protein
MVIVEQDQPVTKAGGRGARGDRRLGGVRAADGGPPAIAMDAILMFHVEHMFRGLISASRGLLAFNVLLSDIPHPATPEIGSEPFGVEFA